LVLANILHNISSDHEKSRRSDATLDTGRLPSFKEAVSFPNIRKTGIADLADCVTTYRLTNAAGMKTYDVIKNGGEIRLKKGWEHQTDLVLIVGPFV
jgi:hypothetical protein